MNTASEIKFTPGPWRIAPPKDYPNSTEINIDAGERGQAAYICQVGQRGDAQAEADALLIRSAPELYEALSDAPILSKYHGMNGFEEARFFADYDAFMAKRRSAIAPVEGR